MNQEQANAIAERELPYPKQFANDQWTHESMCDRIDTRRWAYAKCLMSMNPLIEAAARIQEWRDFNLYICECEEESNITCGPCRDMEKLDTALSNLTKNIEPVR